MKPYEIATFLLFTVITALSIYIINDETQPLTGILRPNYLIPTILYSFSVVFIALAFHVLIRTRINRIVSLVISIVFGLPIGMKIMVAIGNAIL